MFDHYKTCLFDGETTYTEQMLFENKKHEECMVNKHNIALNRNEEAHAADGITALATGNLALSA